MSKTALEFAPINSVYPGSRISLTIRPPGSWFDSPAFHVFVGGSGVGRCRTLASAKATLLTRALAKCDERIARAKAEAEHYERERGQLATNGLRSVPAQKTKRTRKRAP